MQFIDQIQSYLPIAIFLGSGIAWFIRLEYKTLSSEKEIVKIQSRNEVKDSDSDTFRERILVKLENLETTNKFILQSLEELKKK